MNYTVRKIYDNCAKRGYAVVIYENEFGKRFAFGFLKQIYPVYQGYPLLKDIVTYFNIEKRTFFDYSLAETGITNVMSVPSAYQIGDLYIEDNCRVKATKT